MNMFSKLSLLSFLCSIHIEEHKRTQTANGGTWYLPVLIIALAALAVGVIGLVIVLKALREAKSANKNRNIKEITMNNDETLSILRQLDTELKSNDVKIRVKAEDKYIEIVNLREAQYKTDKDIEQYILFWEDNWKYGRPLLGSHWAFVLPDLYIKTKRYEDALKCIEVLKTNVYFKDKAEKYHQKIINKINQMI